MQFLSFTYAYLVNKFMFTVYQFFFFLYSDLGGWSLQPHYFIVLYFCGNKAGNTLWKCFVCLLSTGISEGLEHGNTTGWPTFQCM